MGFCLFSVFSVWQKLANLWRDHFQNITKICDTSKKFKSTVYFLISFSVIIAFVVLGIQTEYVLAISCTGWLCVLFNKAFAEFILVAPRPEPVAPDPSQIPTDNHRLTIVSDEFSTADSKQSLSLWAGMSCNMKTRSNRCCCALCCVFVCVIGGCTDFVCVSVLGFVVGPTLIRY